MLSRSTRKLFDLLIPNTNEVVINNWISQIINGCKRDIGLQEGDSVLAKDYRKLGENWQRGKITENISNNTHKVQLDNGSKWIKHDDRICWPHVQNENPLFPSNKKINYPVDSPNANVNTVA